MLISAISDTRIRPADLGLPADRFPAYREGQDDAFLTITGDETRFSLLSAQTGAGKSLIFMSVARMLGLRTLVLVSTKGLQTQLIRDFESIGAYDIRGHTNYSCAQKIYDEHGELLEMECRNGCQWRPRVESARNSWAVISNYANWVSIGRSDDPDKLGKFDLVVLDEAHLAPDLLVGLLQVKLTRATVHRLISLDLPPDDASFHSAWRRWAVEALNAARLRYRQLKKEDPPAPRELALLAKLGRDLGILASAADDSRWVVEAARRGTGVLLSPVWANDYAERYLYRGASRVILSSATLSPATRRYLGIPEGVFRYHEIESGFDPARRPLIYIPTTRVQHDMTEGQSRLLVRRMDDIIESRLHWRGIVHPRSYGRAAELIRASRWRDSGIFVTHRPGEVRDAIDRYLRQDPPVVLVSPAVEEGFDFPDDACRYQVIAKVPFLDTRGPLISARVKLDKDYSNYCTSQSLTQICGRPMRHRHDFGETMILDDHWSWFRWKGDFANWFRKSFRESRQIPEPLDF